MAKHIYKDGKYTGEEHLSDEEHNRRKRKKSLAGSGGSLHDSLGASIMFYGIMILIVMYFIWYFFFRDAPDVSQFLPHDFYD